MEDIRTYLIRVTAAALICGIVTSITGKKGSIAAMVRLMSVMFLIAVIIAPITRVRLSGMTECRDVVYGEVDGIVAQGQLSSREAVAAIIKKETEAYILDKAGAYGAQITVSVALTEDELPVPKSVRVEGGISPYGKLQLQKLIIEELGIPLEEQTWIGPS